MIITYQDDLPFSAEGFGLARNLYCSGRISAMVGSHGGLTQVNFQGNQPNTRFRILEAKETEIFFKLARVQVLLDGIPYRLTFANTIHYPFGYISECEIDDVRLRHELILDHNVLLQRVKILANPRARKLTARMVHTACCWTPGVEGRKGLEWYPDSLAGTLNAKVTDPADCITAEIRIQMGASKNSRFQLLETQKFKFYMESPVPAEEHVFYLAFNPAADEDFSGARMDAKIHAFTEKMKTVTRFETGNPVLDSALVNANAVSANFEVEIPGALRASPFYWVWAWDSMVHSESFILGGWPEIVRRMLYFFKKYDLAMEYPAHLKVKRSLITSTQLFYVTMLYNYYAMTGDRQTLDDCLPFARDVVEKAIEKIGPDGSLALGRGIFPDHPQCLGQSVTDDYSVINNSVYYQGLRAWAELTGEQNNLARQVGKNFVRLFWDDSEGFWCDSVVGSTLEQRKYYPCYGQLYCSPFGSELRQEQQDRIAAFMKTYFLSEHGIRMLPLQRPGFMADGIQLGEYFPVTDRYYWNVMNAVGDCASLEDFERIIVAYWQICTYPEGQTNEVVNTDPGEYEDCPGLKQAFTAKPWFCDALELHLGLHVKLDGIHLNPLKGQHPFRVSKLVLRGKQIAIERQSGPGVWPVFKLNGKSLKNSFIAWDELTDNNLITIEWSMAR